MSAASVYDPGEFHLLFGYDPTYWRGLRKHGLIRHSRNYIEIKVGPGGLLVLEFET
ncbi:MAG: hypothetical protein HY360_17930 [Verrucomicrobia bacterium]|nr:hypothetical protein [Verrucomicrobiota bacterium]